MVPLRPPPSYPTGDHASNYASDLSYPTSYPTGVESVHANSPSLILALADTAPAAVRMASLAYRENRWHAGCTCRRGAQPGAAGESCSLLGRQEKVCRLRISIPTCTLEARALHIRHAALQHVVAALTLPLPQV